MIPYDCGKVYIGETGEPMQERIKEHTRDICGPPYEKEWEVRWPHG